MSNALLDALLGAMLTCVAAFAASRLGWMEIRLGRKAGGDGRVARESGCLSCAISISSDERGEAGAVPGEVLGAPLRLFATIANEGAVAVRGLRGQWKIVTPGKVRHPVMPIRREVLGPGDQFLDSCRVEAEWETEGVRFEAEIEFDYVAVPGEEAVRERQRYRYDGSSRKMVRLGRRA